MFSANKVHSCCNVQYEELVRSVRTALVADSDEPEELMEKAQSLIQVRVHNVMLNTRQFTYLHSFKLANMLLLFNS